MIKHESDRIMKAAEYTIDAAFDVLRTALANPKGLAHIPNGSTIEPIPDDEHDPEVRDANRELINNPATRGQRTVTLHMITAHVTVTPDGGLLIGQTYFTPDEATELGKMIQIADRPMPGTIGIEFVPDGHVVALRPFFNGEAAESVHPSVLEDHPEIPRIDDDPRSHISTNTFEKLDAVVLSAPVRENRR